MRMDDMILVSVDDHMVEPPDMYRNHVPARWADDAPKVVRNDRGVNPGAYSELRPGCFDVHERVRDMNANGVLASICFPTMAGFNARTFHEARDKEIALVMLQACNDWAIDEWCGSYPGRFIPLGLVPMWVFRDHILACYITDPSGLLLRDRIGTGIIAWECDYPHTDTTWPESPEFAWGELQEAGVPDPEIDQITWQNACRFFGWDPFRHTPRDQATVGALRAATPDVDVTRMPREQWRTRNEAAGIGVF